MKVAGHERPIRVFVVLGVGLISISISAILIRYAAEAPPLAVAAWRTTIAAVILIPFVLLRARRDLVAMSRKEWGLILASGVFLGLHFITFIQSVYYTSVAHAAVLVSMSPIFIGIIGFLFLKQRFKRLEIGAIVLAVGGTALMGFSQSDSIAVSTPHPLLGNSLALTAAFLVAVYLLIGRVVRQNRSWIAYVGPVYVTAALTTLAAALIMDVTLFGYSPRIYLLCLAMAVLPQILGHGSLNYTIRWFSAATIGVASLAEPVGASILAYFLFFEHPTPVAVVGMVIVLAAVAMVLVPYSRENQDK